MKSPLIFSLVVAGIVTLVPAANAAGVNLSWDACTPEGGVQNKTLACDTNAGTRVLYGSFVLTAAQAAFVGVEIKVDISVQSDSLPSWWQFYNLNACRRTALTSQFDFSTDPGTSCTDPWSGQATGGIAAYHTFWTTPQVPSASPNDARIILAAAVPSTMPMQLTANTEYYCFKLVISSAKTVGSGSCSGCTLPACIVLTQISAVQNNGTQEDLTQPVASNVVTWQSAQNCSGAGLQQNVTWGRIRSVLR